jgi:hypothetical protein
MHWFWENADTKERGYCSAAVSRTQHMMWQTEWEEHQQQAPREVSAGRITEVAQPATGTQRPLGQSASGLLLPAPADQNVLDMGKPPARQFVSTTPVRPKR